LTLTKNWSTSPINATVENAAELTPAKLASRIRELQPRPACRDEQHKDAA